METTEVNTKNWKTLRGSISAVSTPNFASQ